MTFRASLLILLALLTAAPRAFAQVGATGITVDPPIMVSLRDRPAQPTDVVLGIARDGSHYLNAKPIRAVDVGPELDMAFRGRTVDRVLYIQADKSLPYSVILNATELAAKAGACVVGLVGVQRAGTTSWVAGDAKPNERVEMRHALFARLPDPAYAGRWGEGEAERVLLEVRAPKTLLVNGQAMLRANLLSSLRRIFAPRPEKGLFFKGDPRVPYVIIMDALDIARAVGVELGLAPRDLPAPSHPATFDPKKAASRRDDFTGPGASLGMAPCPR